MDSSTLTEAQQRAAFSTEKNNLVLAGPGSGKTRTLIARVIHLIAQGHDPRLIIVITFTNAAAKEVAKRLEAEGVTVLGYIGTLHGYCLRNLERFGHVLGYSTKISLIEPEDAERLFQETVQSLGMKMGPKVKKALEEFPRDARPRTAEEIAVGTWRKRMREASLVDFDTILWDFALVLEKTTAPLEPVDLIVDEFQDSGEADFLIYSRLNAASRFYVGDPDQAIYSFRGGRLENILAIGESPVFTNHLLEGNFRSGRAICATAQKVIERNTVRMAKATVPMLDFDGAIANLAPFHSDQLEATGIAAALKARIDRGENAIEMAVLARTNAAVSLIAEAVKGYGIPVRERRKRKMPLDFPKARLAVELLNNPDNPVLVLRWVLEASGSQRQSEVKRAIATSQDPHAGKYVVGLTEIETVGQVPEALSRLKVSREAIEWVMEKADEMVEPTVADLAIAVAQDASAEMEMGHGVTVCTMHAAKGREWGLVVLAALEREVIPGNRALKDPLSLEEERRLFYVAITRAKSFLVLSHAHQRRQPWGQKLLAPATPSPFLQEVA